MLNCDLCNCLVLHKERAVVGSWYVVCEHCDADLNEKPTVKAESLSKSQMDYIYPDRSRVSR